MNTTNDYRRFAAVFLQLPVEKLGDDVPLRDVMADSFETIELLIALQDEFPCALNQKDFAEIDTFGQLFALVHNNGRWRADMNAVAGLLPGVER